jgi:HK97 family phage portal protein
MLPLNLMVDQNGTRQVAHDHSMQSLLKHGPNEFMTSQEYKELIMAHLALRGNHYSFINRVGGRITELLPLNPATVEPKLNGDWSVEYKVTFANGQQETLTSDQVWHVRLMTCDGLTGLSPIAQARNAIGLAKVTERHANKFFKNSAQPAGGFKTSAKLNAEQREALKTALDGYTGEGAFKNLILEGGLEVSLLHKFGKVLKQH